MSKKRKYLLEIYDFSCYMIIKKQNQCIILFIKHLLGLISHGRNLLKET